MVLKSKDGQLPDEIIEAEVNRIRRRRRIVLEETGREESDTGDPRTDAVGLALSGGGIRSATFNLGILQALARYDKLSLIDYLSTVSGGGYIGSSLTWFMSVRNQKFPFGQRRRDNLGRAGRIVSWLRAHGNYLIPGNNIDLWALFATVLNGTLVSLTILLPIFFLVIYLLARPIPGGAENFICAVTEFRIAGFCKNTGFAFLWWIGCAVALLLVIVSFVYAIITRFSYFRTVGFQKKIRMVTGRLLMWAIFFITTGTLPLVYDWFPGGRLMTWISLIFLSGLILFLVALWGLRQAGYVSARHSILLSFGLTLAVYSLFLCFLHISVGMTQGISLWIYFGCSVPALILALFANINHVSMHRFYRNRLMETYLPEGKDIGDIETIAEDSSNISADDCTLSKIPQSSAPYQIINANVQLTGSQVSRYRSRGGDNFFFTPEYCGGSATGFRKTDRYENDKVNLATACAISGAAIDPNTYYARSKPLAFVMTLLNLRLGYWITNPKIKTLSARLIRAPWYWYLFREIFSEGLNEELNYIHLSDGGHFENLGLYELVRRRCKKIIVCDAGADPGFNFADLARVIELVRTDFGAEINIDIKKIKPKGEARISDSPFVEGDITYADDNGFRSKLLYIKTVMLDDLGEDINGYRHQHPEFPDEPTHDQFFDEFQFEAYRELGYQTIKRVVLAEKWGKLTFFDDK